MMREKSIHRLLVFSESGVGASQRPIGILSASDIVREAGREVVNQGDSRELHRIM
jgi:hypothetical protein